MRTHAQLSNYSAVLTAFAGLASLMLIACGPNLRAQDSANVQVTPHADALPFGWAGGYTHVAANGNKSGEVALLIKVKTALVADPRLIPFMLEVGVLGGVVTLYGQVETNEHKAIAEHIARQVHGVLEVKSGIAVAARA